MPAILLIAFTLTVKKMRGRYMATRLVYHKMQPQAREKCKNFFCESVQLKTLQWTLMRYVVMAAVSGEEANGMLTGTGSRSCFRITASGTRGLYQCTRRRRAIPGSGRPEWRARHAARIRIDAPWIHFIRFIPVSSPSGGPPALILFRIKLLRFFVLNPGPLGRHNMLVRVDRVSVASALGVFHDDDLRVAGGTDEG